MFEISYYDIACDDVRLIEFLKTFPYEQIAEGINSTPYAVMLLLDNPKPILTSGIRHKLCRFIIDKDTEKYPDIIGC